MTCDNQTINMTDLHIIASEVQKVHSREKELLKIISKLSQEKDIAFMNELHILGSEVEKVCDSYFSREKELLKIISKLSEEKDEITFINKCYEAEIESLLKKIRN